jgi:hydroxymethylpyrimidine/phosphomethylpyrimidine kinase
MTRLPQALTIAASDSGGGAGIQADIKTMQAHGVYGLSVLVAITAQNTRSVTMAHPLPRGIIEAQISAVFDDFKIGAVKTGMLYSDEIVGIVSDRLRALKVRNLVVDPVLHSKGGAVLLKEEAIERMKHALFPLAALVMPNVPEAERFSGITIQTLDEAEEAARLIHRLSGGPVLIKGGHLAAAPATDLFYDGSRATTIHGEFIHTPHTHGTGCTYSAAVTAQLAKGRPLLEAVRRAKRYVTEAIRHGLSIGHGQGPTHHFYFLPPDPV